MLAPLLLDSTSNETLSLRIQKNLCALASDMRITDGTVTCESRGPHLIS